MNAKLLLGILITVVIVFLGTWFGGRNHVDTILLPPDVTLPDGGKYFGEHQNGVFEGQGKIIWPDGSKYEGSFSKGQFSGFGELFLKKDEKYEGHFVEGALTGLGKYRTRYGDFYEGELRDYEPHGQGKWIYKNGSSYAGGFKNTLYDGQGIYTTVDGKSYEGSYVEGVFTGQGIYKDNQGNEYRGEFKNWMYHGKGKFVSTDKSVYEGEFSHGSFTGTGTYKTVEGESYSGQFDSWEYDGDGELTGSNGDHYKGQFSYGQYDGEGVLTYANPVDGVSQLEGKWSWGQYQGKGEGPTLLEASVETALYNQSSLLISAVDAIKPSDSDKINMYFVGVAGDGRQDVFYKEVTGIRDIFDAEFGTKQRSLLLVNNAKTVDDMMLATATSLERSLQAVSTKMDAENDILFLYLTSHGSKEHQFVLKQPGLTLPNLPAKQLGKIVNDLPIKWKVIVISACYAGGFIPDLENDHTLVITAAAKDRKSFGCSDDAEMTYFGKAFIEDSLTQTSSFENAFMQAKALIKKREEEIVDGKNSKHSKPQISSAEAISNHLEKWRAQF